MALSYTVKLTHISLIRPGDTVETDGGLKTVSPKDLRKGFMGITLWGDSFRLGTTPVRLAIFSTPTQGANK